MINSKIEKYALFSTDFRGLPNGWHNLRAFNFLVGENSTGKSSFLQLIELIDSREHMMFLDICGVVSGIDTAFDVCSRRSGNKETTIGFLIKEVENEETEPKKKKKRAGVFGRLATYKKSDDKMELTRLTIVSGSQVLRLRRSQDGMYIRFDEFQYSDQSTHTENGEEIEKIHLRSKDRFRKAIDVNWSEGAAVTHWFEGIFAASEVAKKQEKPPFSYSGPPLNSLSHGPIRAKTRRLYHGNSGDFSSTGEHTPYILRDMLNASPNLTSAINDFGKSSGLYDNISVTAVKTAIKDKPFALQIEKSGSYYYVDELGFGVSQVLPIITDIAFTSNKHAFLIQQPELHLHPRAQAALGDVFLASSENGKTFVVETHSDFIIDRFRLKHKQSENPPRAQIVFFDKLGDGTNRAYEIEINSDGTLENVPDGFRTFFVNEAIDKFENF